MNMETLFPAELDIMAETLNENSVTVKLCHS